MPFGREPFHHRVIGLDHLDVEIAPGLVAERALADELPPFVGASHAIAVRRAVHHHRGQPVEVRLGDPLDEFIVLHETEALVVQHDVVALRPVRLFVNAHAMLAIRAFANDGPFDIGPLG